MTDQFDTDPQTAPTPAYVRPVPKSEVENAPEDLPVDTLYALHDEDGRPLAIFANRAAAEAAARTHNYVPVSLH